MSVVVVGGTAGLGHEVARHYADAGREVVITGRDPDRAKSVAAELGGSVSGVGFDLSEPEGIADALSDVGEVDHLVLVAVDRDQNSVADYDIGQARHLATLKLVGYTETVHTLLPRMSEDASIVMFGGQALERPYPGSTTVSTVNAGVTGMVRTLSVELAPIRVNSIHPGIVGDSPYWVDKPLDAFRAGTLTGRLATTQDIVGAVVFLLENPGVNGVHLVVDGGWR
ncbi:MAG: SDR family oxidoreductase [Propionibacteriales bacterium]|nr:SDR family oxidoreductase [Propionibacteriales bacterium]